MTKFLIDKTTNTNIFLPKQVNKEGIKGNLVITIDNKVLFITDTAFEDVTSNYTIVDRDN